MDREIRVGVPATRADGSGRRTAGQWVAPPAVAAVRFTRLSGRRTRLSRARLGKAVGVPRGTDDPQGPVVREQAGSPAGHPDGALGGCPSQSSGHPHRAPAPGSATCHGGHASGSRRTGPHRPPLVLVRADPPIRTLGSRLGSRSLPVARQVPVLSRPPRFCRAGAARAGWQPPGQGARRSDPEALTFL